MLLRLNASKCDGEMGFVLQYHQANLLSLLCCAAFTLLLCSNVSYLSLMVSQVITDYHEITQ